MNLSGVNKGKEVARGLLIVDLVHSHDTEVVQYNTELGGRTQVTR